MSVIPFPTLEEQLSFADCCGENPEIFIWEIQHTVVFIEVRCKTCESRSAQSGFTNELKAMMRTLAKSWAFKPNFISDD